MGKFSNNFNPLILTADQVRHLKCYRTARDNFLIGKKCQFTPCQNNNLSVHHHWTFWNAKYMKGKIVGISKEKYNLDLTNNEINNLIVILMKIQLKEYISFKNCDVFCKEHHHEQHNQSISGAWTPACPLEGHHPLNKELHKILRGIKE